MFQTNIPPPSLGPKIKKAHNKHQANGVVACLLFAWLIIFWDMMPRSLIDKCQRFREHLQGRRRLLYI
jgi:hypothetical protein